MDAQNHPLAPRLGSSATVGASLYTQLAFPLRQAKSDKYEESLLGGLLYYEFAAGRRTEDQPFSERELAAAVKSNGSRFVPMNSHFEGRVMKRLRIGASVLPTLLTRAGSAAPHTTRRPRVPVNVYLDRVEREHGTIENRNRRREYWQESFPVFHWAAAFCWLAMPSAKKGLVDARDLLTNPAFIYDWVAVAGNFAKHAAAEWPDHTERYGQLMFSLPA